MILAIAHLRGRDISDIESRRLDVLLAIGIADGRRRDQGRHADERRSSALDPAKLDELPDEVVGRINRELADRVT